MERSTKVALGSVMLYGAFFVMALLGDGQAPMGTALGLPVLLQLYLLPSIVAYARGHHNENPILLLNLLLGWTLLGWIAALIWSATATRPAPGISRRLHPSAPVR